MDKLDLDGIELDLKTHHTSTRTSEVFRGHIRDLLAEIRLQRAAPAPKGEAPEIPSQGSPGTREAVEAQPREDKASPGRGCWVLLFPNGAVTHKAAAKQPELTPDQAAMGFRWVRMVEADNQEGKEAGR